VVSEERGKVSVACGRDITPVADQRELSQAIRKHLKMPEISPAHQRKRERLKLATAGFVSFLIISGIWLAFTRGQDTIVALNVPIEYVNRPASYDILDTSVDEARLQLFGSSALIRSLGPEQVAVRVNLSKATKGRNTFAITQDDVILPPGISLNRIKPSTLVVTLDTPSTKMIPIQVDWTGRLPQGTELADVSVTPPAVKVVGGSTALDKVDTIYTCPVRLDSLPKTGATTAELLLSPPSIKLSPASTGIVTIHYRLVKIGTPKGR
jgi:YbbR domain-containing protein